MCRCRLPVFVPCLCLCFTSINTRATHGEHCVFVISYRNFSLLNVMHNHNLKNNVYVGIKYNV
jgi:hypothetical protein